jgi:lambda repressor-like predicted transcriptional regulator
MDTQKNFIEERLEELGWSIDRLARETGMSYSQTHDIVTNGFRPGTRIGNIEKIAEALGVSVLDILDKHPRKE